MSQSRGKVLVIRGGAIGDFILTLPVLQALRLEFPNVHLEVLGYPHIAHLAKASGLADEVKAIEAPALAGFFAYRGELNPVLATYFREFALIISYLYDPDAVFQSNVKRCSAAQFIAAPYRPDDSQVEHATDVFLGPLEELAIFEPERVPRLRLPSGEVGLSSCEADWLAIHPGSGSERKNWAEEKWMELVQVLIQRTRYNLLLVGGEAEAGRLDRLEQIVPRGRGKKLESLPLAELGQYMTACTGFIGHDSGIAHLAAAIGLPGLILWGPSNARVWSPLSEDMTLLHGEQGLDSLTVDHVLEKLKSVLPTGWPDR